MKRLLFFALSCAALLGAADAPKPALKPPAVLSAEQVNQLEKLTYREQLAQKELQLIQYERMALVTQACKSAGVELERCVIDPQTKQITSAPEKGKPKLPPAKQ